MDEIDRRILNLVQEEFPISERPFEEIGRAVGVSEEEAFERVRRMREEGVVRRIGPVLEKRQIGYVGMLCGTAVDEWRIEAVAEELSRHKGVTHCYEREGELNLWFTIIASSTSEIEEYLDSVERRFCIKIQRFKEKRVFKIKTYFPV
jgi:DNA-binding Lrp family transcriptional regulator